MFAVPGHRRERPRGLNCQRLGFRENVREISVFAGMSGHLRPWKTYDPGQAYETPSGKAATSISVQKWRVCSGNTDRITGRQIHFGLGDRNRLNAVRLQGFSSLSYRTYLHVGFYALVGLMKQHPRQVSEDTLHVA